MEKVDAEPQNKACFFELKSEQCGSSLNHLLSKTNLFTFQKSPIANSIAQNQKSKGGEESKNNNVANNYSTHDAKKSLNK